jgi:hypothetical protein
LKKILSFKSKSEVIAEEKSNRIFFHDLINHTHGILLFLNQKIIYNKSANLEELELLNHEVKLLQSLISDHFKYEHKNLVNTHEYVPFSVFFQSVQLLLKIYFPENVKIATELKGDIAFYESEDKQQASVVHYPSLYRIMNNLIKNMAEANTSEMKFYFEYNNQGLIIETQNVLGQKHDKGNIVDYLSRVILKEEKKKHVGIGLDSINEIVDMAEGKFTFDIHENVWINKIFIPHNNSTKNKIAA